MTIFFWWWWFSKYVSLSINTCYVIVKKEKGTDYVIFSKSKGVYTFKLKHLYTAFLHGIKLSGYEVGIKFDKGPLAVKQNHYTTKIVTAYII